MTRSVISRRAGALAVSAGLGLALAAGGAAAQERLAMGGTHSNSAFYAYQVAVVSDWNENVEGVDITIQELGGAAASTAALVRGEVDMGIAVTSSDFESMNAEGADTLRTLFFFAPLPLNWVVAADSGIDSIAAIGDAAFSPGGRGTATEGQVDEVSELLEYGLNMHRGGATDALDAYQNRRIDGFVKAGMHPDGYIQQAHSSRPVTFLEMSQEDAERVVGEAPYFSVARIDPGDFYGDQGGERVTVQTAIGINTTTDLSEEVVYGIVSRVFSEEGISAAASGYPPAAAVDPAQLTLDAAVAPLHAGVVRYFREQGVEVPENLVPPEFSE